ncbi:MAG: acyltransferase family protein [Eubacteriales bacterium]|nr:acyltransferase family protein [Eubacteriales bacterium]
MKERESNLDLLRIIATIAVVAVHVSGYYASAITTQYWLGDEYTSHVLTTSLYRVVSSFAVPVFVMLSGKFALSKPQNKNYKYYYKKELCSIGIPMLTFTVLYFLYGNIRNLATGLISHKSVVEIMAGGGQVNS